MYNPKWILYLWILEIETFDLHRLSLRLSDKINLKISYKYFALSNLSIYYSCTIRKYKKINRNNDFKISTPTWNEDFWITWQIILCIRYSKLFWVYCQKNIKYWLVIRIYVNKMKNMITLRIKIGYCLKLLMPEMTKLLGSTKSKITKDKNGGNVPHLEITEIVLAHCNIVQMIIN